MNCIIFICRKATDALLTLLLILTVAQLSFAQTITIPEITGLTFNKTGADYSTLLTENFRVYGLQFVPDSLVLNWQEANNVFTLTGNGYVAVFGDTLRVTSETDSILGIVISEDTLSNVSFSIYSDFKISGVEYKVDNENHPILEYSDDYEKLVIWGDADMFVDGESYSGGKFGNSSSPGIVLGNGIFEKVQYHVQSEVFNLYGLELNNPNLTFELDIPDGNFKGSRYIGYGNAEFMVINAGLYVVDMGKKDSPAVRINNGVIDTLQITAEGGALLAGALPTLGDLKLRYLKSQDQYQITGNVLVGVPFGGLVKAVGVKYAPSLTINAEDGGIIYRTDTKSLHIDDAEFILGDIPLGVLELREFTIGVENNQLSEARGDVKFPPGYIMGAEFFFDTDPFRFHGFGIDWTATTVANSIPVGNTGLNFVHFEGDLLNLDKLPRFDLDVKAGFVYGDILVIRIINKDTGAVVGSKEVVAIYIEGDIEFKHLNELDFEVDVMVGAAQVGEDWEGYLGKGDAKVHLVFGKEYSIEANLGFPIDPILEADAKILVEADGSLLAEAEVDLEIPHFIPIIGGRKLASADGVVVSVHNKPDQSYAAGWTKINFGFGKKSIGGKINFGDGKFKSVGSAGIKNIREDVKNFGEANQLKSCSWYKSFDINENSDQILPYYLQLDIKVVDQSKVVLDNGLSLYIESPDGSNEHIWLEEVQFREDGELERVDDGYWGSYIQLESGRDSVFAVAGRHEAILSSDDGNATFDPGLALVYGSYNLVLTAECTDGGNHAVGEAFDIDINYMYPPPTITINDERVDFRSHFIDSTTVSIYMNSENSTSSGTLVTSYEYPQNADGPFFRNFDIEPGIVDQPYFYYYGVIDDNLNSPVYTAIDSIALGQDMTFRFNGPAGLDSILIVIDDMDGNTLHQLFGSTEKDVYLYNVPDGVYDLNFYLPETADELTKYAWLPEHFSTSAAATFPRVRQESWMEVDRLTKAGETIIISRVQETSAQFYGLIKDNQTDAHIEGVNIALKTEDDFLIDTATSTVSGFGFFDQPAGTYKVELTLPDNYLWKKSDIQNDNQLVREVTVDYDGQLEDLELYAIPGSNAIYGQVTDFGGAGLSQATISITGKDPFGGNVTYTAHSNAKGYYRFLVNDILGNTFYSLRVNRTGYKSLIGTIPVDYGNQPLKVNVSMLNN